MRFIMLLLSTLFFVTSAHAESLGIDFKSMPRGTKVYYESSQGPKWVATFKGKRGKFYRFDVRSIPDDANARRTELFNMDGHLVKVEYKKMRGQSVTFKPFHCGRIIGKCAMSSTKQKGMRVGNKEMKLITRYSYDTARTKKGLRTKSTEMKLGLSKKTASMELQKSHLTINATLTKYNLFGHRSWVRDGKKGWTKITRIEE